MKLMLGLASGAALASAAEQKPITGDDLQPWMPPAGALSDGDFKRLCGTMMSADNPLYLSEACQGTAEWCLGRLYSPDDFPSPTQCLASRRRKPWREASAAKPCRRARIEECVGSETWCTEECAGTESWCTEGLWKGSDERFSGPRTCLASREPKPRTVRRPKRVVVDETWTGLGER